MNKSQLTNDDIANVMDEIANLLEAQEANPFRVRSYREGANTLRQVDEPVTRIVEREGTDGLQRLPNIGQGLAALIGEVVETGRSDLLDRLRGEVSPVSVFARVPGIGERLAQRVVDELDIRTLEELEEAAHDGRLARVEGFGARRVEAVRNSLAGMLSRGARSRARQRVAGDGEGSARPSVALLLEIDREYRQRAEAGELRTIAPTRFNPTNEAWLPIMETAREGWTFTALYSNTARAHELGKTRDWVVIYYERDGQERQNTVVTETSGPLAGKRVVRGRAEETRRYYREQSREPQ